MSTASERRLISKAVYSTDFDAVLDAGVTEEMFLDPDGRRAFAFAARFCREYSRSPTPRVMKTELPDYRLLPDVKEPLAYWIDRVRRDWRQHAWDEAGDRMADALEAKDPDRASAIAEETARRTADSGGRKTVSIADLLDHYWNLWESRAKGESGLIGIDTGFPSVNAATLGWQPSQLITIAGLGGAGKSTLLMLMAREAQRQKRSPYFMSFEMTEEEQIGRYVAMEIGVPYNRLIAGKLEDREKRRFFEARTRIIEAEVFTLCTDILRSATVPGLEAELRRRRRPDVVFVDGVYLMRDPETRKSGADWQAMTNITRDMKQMAQRLEIPVVMSTQALPSKTTRGQSRTHRKLDMYSAGYSSSFAQDSDVMFGLERDEGKAEERLLRITKARHCAAHSVWIEWSWKTASFGAPLSDPDYEVDEDDEGDDE